MANTPEGAIKLIADLAESCKICATRVAQKKMHISQIKSIIDPALRLYGKYYMCTSSVAVALLEERGTSDQYVYIIVGLTILASKANPISHEEYDNNPTPVYLIAMTAKDDTWKLQIFGGLPTADDIKNENALQLELIEDWTEEVLGDSTRLGIPDPQVVVTSGAQNLVVQTIEALKENDQEE